MDSKKHKSKNYIKKHIKSFFHYDYADEQLMIESVTHKSCGKKNYERLEFLGDTVIQLVITEILLEKFSDSNEGELTRMRQHTVNRTTLSKIALELHVDRILICHNLDIEDNDSLKKSITAELLESIIGGIYLDSNYQKCKTIITKIFNELIDSNMLTAGKDPKTKLQEFLQSKNLKLPVYKKTKIRSPDHNPKFKITCKISVLDKIISTTASTVKEGEQIVAQKILDKISHEK